MKPLTITMQAFGSYSGKTQIDLTKPSQNIFLIRGNTGAGKTTIFDAIVFALYGEASSTANKKVGAELQSQFADLAVEPFVELTFTEKEGEEVREYTVHRVPRHVRPLQRRGKGKVVEVKESVSLRLPDGSEYTGSARETDEKLTQIVGLTKEQFMQVAMIAQGEFMELLRAKSDTKKLIFRKLFGTQLYSRIVDELLERKRDKEAQIERIRVACQTEIAHVEIPEEYEGAEAAGLLQKRVQRTESFAADLDGFLAELDLLCAFLKSSSRKAEKESQKAALARDAARDALQSAKALSDLYVLLEQARKEIAACAEEEERIQEAQKLSREIGDAYEIKAAFDRLRDSENACASAAEALRNQTEKLPALEKERNEFAALEADARKQLDEENERLTKIRERVSKALDTFAKVQRAEKERTAAQKAAETARKASEKASGTLKTLEEQEKEWRRQEEGLRDLGERRAVLQAKMAEGEEISRELERALAENRDLRKRHLQYTDLRKQFEEKDQAYKKARELHERAQDTFLAAQAGLLANSLKEGEPCPVCGSVHHPAPRRLTVDANTITRERLEELSKNAEELRSQREKASQSAGTALEVLQDRRQIYKETEARLRDRIIRNVPGTAQSEGQEDMELLRQAFVRWQEGLAAQEHSLRKEEEKARKLRDLLTRAEQEKERLRKDSEEALKRVTEAGEAFARSSAALAQMKGMLDFPSEQEAQATLAGAAQQQKGRKEAFEKAADAARKAGASLEQAKALKARYEKEIPELTKVAVLRRDAYEELRESRKMAEERWQELTAAYRREEQEVLQKAVSDHRQKEAAARRAQEEAEKGIGGREKPVLEELQTALEAADRKALETRAAADRYRELYRVDETAREKLSAGKENRTQMTQEYSRIESLYSRLAGKISGSRMDIETYVQRYWLERILHAANLRFQEMSAGQFELRMCGEEFAGVGKNRGLDLMVYSNVTGREREIRTLSGGESFMAALSLALGMADQIRAGKATVNLDIMFIDEGFGSLDSTAREQAVRVLKQMAGGERMIGIISHVTELGQEIEDQLLVTKDDTGSHVQWQLS